MNSPTTQTTQTGSRFSTVRLVTMALFVAILAVSAYISIPLPLPGAPHITMLNFVIILIALLFSPAEGFLIILIWMILGVIGVPVFIGGRAGIGYLLAPYGGYTLVFPLIGLLLPLIRGKQYSRPRYTAAAVIGVLLIDFLGMFWLMGMNHLGLKAGLLTGFVPFLPLDLLKAIVAAQIVPAFRRVMRTQPA